MIVQVTYMAQIMMKKLYKANTKYQIINPLYLSLSHSMILWSKRFLIKRENLGAHGMITTKSRLHLDPSK